MNTEHAAASLETVLVSWNQLDPAAAANEILPCCGSRRWAKEMSAARPFATAAELVAASDTVWSRLPVSDWDEAFASHPRIGEGHAPASATSRSAAWSTTEQDGVSAADHTVRRQLRLGNRAYEQRFGRTYIVCAAGKSAVELLAILEDRLRNDSDSELREAAEQQRQITRLRIGKWLLA